MSHLESGMEFMRAATGNVVRFYRGIILYDSLSDVALAEPINFLRARKG